MRNAGFWLVTVACAVAIGCGGDDGNDNQVIFIDAASGDANNTATCNPFSQQGCQAGEKCASVTVQQDPRIVQTLCVPDGTVAQGEACEQGEAGPTTGYDDCVAFNECVFGECRPVCQQVGDPVAGSCEGAAVCQIFNNLFKDLATDDIGICIPQCNPPAGITRAGAEITIDYAEQCGTLQCYMNVFDGIGVCAGSFEGAAGHNMSCGESCALNSCAPGHGPFLPGPTTNMLGAWQEETVFFANNIFGLADVCIQFCDPQGETAATDDMNERGWTADPGTGAPSNFQANCPISNECRYVTGVYIDFDDAAFAPDSFGLCIPSTVGLGSCSEHVLDDIEAYLTEQGQTPVPVPSTNKFIPGCSTGPVVLAKVEELIAADNPALAPADVKKKAREVTKRLSARIVLPPMALPQ